MNFNKQKFLELWVKSRKLLQQGTTLWNYDKAKNKELTQYLTLLSDDIFWRSRYQYFQILENLNSGSINVDEFIQKFDALHRSNRKASKIRIENLEYEIDVELNPESRGFTHIISSISMTIELFNPEITLDMNLKDPEL